MRVERNVNGRADGMSRFKFGIFCRSTKNQSCAEMRRIKQQTYLSSCYIVADVCNKVKPWVLYPGNRLLIILS